ncbi:MAG: hypothetical protein M3R59_07360 [Verrucomicrobiota bacterium]|nr:hypothetical protein [Verrucomicrobiota bacterium]
MPRKKKISDKPKSNAEPSKDEAKLAAEKTARKRATARQPAARARKPTVTDDDIRIRAFFISQERHRLHIGGDASADWIEARRQLLAEAGN